MFELSMQLIRLGDRVVTERERRETFVAVLRNLPPGYALKEQREDGTWMTIYSCLEDTIGTVSQA